MPIVPLNIRENPPPEVYSLLGGLSSTGIRINWGQDSEFRCKLGHRGASSSEYFSAQDDERWVRAEGYL